MLAQGRPVDDFEEEVSDAPGRERAPSLFGRLFPPAAPLPGKPDAMSGFTYTGRLRPLVASLWLIRRNPIAGIAMGALWAIAYVITIQYGRELIGTISSFISFGSLVAAGWIGWQRPWLYGLVAALVGYVMYSGWVAYILLNTTPRPTSEETSQIALGLLFNGLLQTAIGALAGFYGGYLRRRLADPSTRRAAAARRRR